MAEKDFVTWLIDEMNKRGWSNSELARRSDVVPSAISMLISGHNKPGLELCLGIARAFKFPPEFVLRLAGLVPPLPDDIDTQQTTKCLDYYKRLPSKVREEVLEYMAFKYEREQE